MDWKVGSAAPHHLGWDPLRPVRLLVNTVLAEAEQFLVLWSLVVT